MKNLFSVAVFMVLCQFSYAQTLTCNNVKVTVVSVTASEIQVEVDVTAYGNQINAPGDRSAAFTLTNGTCPGCKPVGGPNNPDVRTWTIQNQPGETTLTFTSFMGDCVGKSLALEQTSTECGGIKLTLISQTSTEFVVEIDATNYPHQLSHPNHYGGSQFEVVNGTCEGCTSFKQTTNRWTIKKDNSGGKAALRYTRFAGSSCKDKIFPLE